VRRLLNPKRSLSMGRRRSLVTTADGWSKPATINVFLHDNNALTNETDQLSEDYVLDARFVTNQSLTQVSIDLLRALPGNVKFSLSHPKQHAYSPSTHRLPTSSSRQYAQHASSHWATLPSLGPRPSAPRSTLSGTKCG
jgi:hypothetical protein